MKSFLILLVCALAAASAAPSGAWVGNPWLGNPWLGGWPAQAVWPAHHTVAVAHSPLLPKTIVAGPTVVHGAGLWGPNVVSSAGIIQQHW